MLDDARPSHAPTLKLTYENHRLLPGYPLIDNRLYIPLGMD